jgi:hypothetical protein
MSADPVNPRVGISSGSPYHLISPTPGEVRPSLEAPDDHSGCLEPRQRSVVAPLTDERERSPQVRVGDASRAARRNRLLDHTLGTATGKWKPRRTAAVPLRLRLHVVREVHVVSNLVERVEILDWPPKEALSEELLVGIRTDLRFQVRVLTERFADTLEVGLLTYLRADVQLQHPEGFNVITGVGS